MNDLSPKAAAIRMRGVERWFGETRALANFDLDVESGHLMTLLGPSGSGKTTALRLIAGFDRPDDGTIEIDGVPVAGPSTYIPAEQRRVGMVFQDYALFPHLSVQRNVGYGVNKGQRTDRVPAVLELVGLTGKAHRMPHELSGGEQQRVALARALAPRPGVILLDEPFSNLDASLRIKVRNEIAEILRRAGTTAVFVTHDQEEALAMSDRIAVMKDGRIEQIGAPLEIYDRPSSRFVADFIGDTNIIEGRVEAGSDGRPQITAPGIMQPLADGGAIAGGHAAVALRPEKIRLAGNGAAFDITVSGIVELANFHGESVLLRVAVDGGPRLLARAPNDGTGRPPRPGDRLMLGWNRDDAVPLRS